MAVGAERISAVGKTSLKSHVLLAKVQKRKKVNFQQRVATRVRKDPRIVLLYWLWFYLAVVTTIVQGNGFPVLQQNHSQNINAMLRKRKVSPMHILLAVVEIHKYVVKE